MIYCRRMTFAALVGYVCLTCVNSVMAFADDGETLTQKLVALRREGSSPERDTKALERQYRDVAEACKTEEERGRVYVAVSRMYCEAGLLQPENAKKAVEYATLAHECPLGLQERLEIAVHYGEALSQIDVGSDRDALVQRTTKVAQAYLEGLKVALDNAIPTQDIKVPDANCVMDADGGGYDPSSPADRAEEAARQRRLDERIRAFDEAARINKAVRVRRTLEHKLACLLAENVDLREDILGLARETLQNDIVVTGLMSQSDEVEKPGI